MGIISNRIARAIGFTSALPLLMFGTSSAVAKPGVRAVEVGPIWNQMDAQRKCPEAAREAGGTWTGDWRTVRAGQMSVCDVARAGGGGGGGGGGGHGRGEWIDAGPIWNQVDADRKCPQVANGIGGNWTGQWKTTRPGQMSVCEIKK